MNEAVRAYRVLFVQKPEVLESQKEQVTLRLKAAIPGVQIDFTGSPYDVEPGTSYDVIITPTLPWLAELLENVSTRWIHFLSAGVEKIWAMPFDKTGMLLTKSSGVHGAPMSEFAIGAMLFFAKQFNHFVARSNEGAWERRWLEELTDKHLVILGLGHIGQMLAARAKIFGMRVSGTARRVRSMADIDKVVELANVASLLETADYVVCCLPLTGETLGLVNDGFLASIKPGAVFVDISRGGIVQAEAVLSALESGRLKGAALDVFEQQPLPTDSPLWRQEKILVTPHVSGTTPHYLDRALDVFLDNHQRIVSGLTASTAVDLELGY